MKILEIYPKKIFLTALLVCISAFAWGIEIKCEIDAQDLPRKLLHARMEIPVEGGELRLWYPKWVPGTHSPGGPIQNLAGLAIVSSDGTPIGFRRDLEERYQFICEIPRDVTRIVVELDYICNQPSTNSRGVDSYGNALIGVINWNTCLLYPDGFSNTEISVALSLELPDGWKGATSLKRKREEGNHIEFTTTTLQEVVDSPLICGEHLRSIPLEAGDAPPHTLHIVSESKSALLIEEDLIKTYGRIAEEAIALFGGGHFEAYELMVICSDDFPYTGLEHLRSSINGIGERSLFDEDELKGWVGNLLPHEYAHSWCGKYRRPKGMATGNYHSVKDTSLLWVYEGIDTYLGEILAVRGGLWTEEHYEEVLALHISDLMHQKGRKWRSLEDTAIDGYHLRGGSKYWKNLRREQDYYYEGVLLWMDADAIIREKTDNKKSLNDFCRAFFDPKLADAKDDLLAFDEAEVIERLEALADHDWTAFFDKWVKKPQESLPLEFVERLGYRLQYTTDIPEFVELKEKAGEYVNVMDSLGLTIGEDGTVASNVVPGMPAEVAGIAPDMKVMGVNGRKYSKERLLDAVADSVTKGEIEFLTLCGDVFKTIVVPYSDGAKYLKLVRNESSANHLKHNLEPLTQ